MEIRVVVGDLATVAVEAAIVAVNPHGLWGGLHFHLDETPHDWIPPSTGGIDGCILRAAGTQFHQQALRLLACEPGTTLLASSQRPHHGAFERVVFVCDDTRASLESVVKSALAKADEQGIQSVSMGLLRAGVVAKPPFECMGRIVAALKHFKPQNLNSVSLVTPHPRLAGAWQAVLEGRRPQPLQFAIPAESPLLDVVEASVFQTAADAVLITVDPGPVWRGSVQNALREAAGDQFHRQAVSLTVSQPGSCCATRATEPHELPFKAVVFVVDDHQIPLRQLVEAGLAAADEAGHHTVSVPALRLGLLRGENDLETLEHLAQGAMEALKKSTHLRRVRFVFLEDSKLALSMRALLLETASRDVWIECPCFDSCEEVAAVSDDGRHMLHSPRPGRLTLSEVCSGKACDIIELPWGDGARLDLATLDHDGKRALVCSRFGNPELHQIGEPEPLLSMPPKVNPSMPVGCKAVTFSPDGELVATGYYHRQVEVWRADDGENVASFKLPEREGRGGYETLITSLEFSADGSLLFAGTADGCWEIWELDGGRSLAAEHNPQRYGPPRAELEDVTPPDSLLARLRPEGAPYGRTYQADGFLATTREQSSFSELVCWEFSQNILRPLWKAPICPAQGLPPVFFENREAVVMRWESPLVRCWLVDASGTPRRTFTLSDEEARGAYLQKTLYARIRGELTEDFEWLAWAPQGPYPLLDVIHGCRRMYRFRRLSRDRRHLLCQTDDRTLLLSGKPWRVQAILPRNEIPIAAGFSDRLTVLTLNGSVFVKRL